MISFGIAAGLAPGRAAGATCLVGREVVHEGRSYSTDADWAARLEEGDRPAACHDCRRRSALLTSVCEKRALHAHSGAVAADMESHIVARLAAQHGLPFAVLRVIADPAEQDIPPAALAGMASDGGIDVRAVLSLAGEGPGSCRGCFASPPIRGRAVAALLRCHNLLGPGLGFGDLG